MNTPQKKTITDLAELRSAIRSSKSFLVIVRNEDGGFGCFVNITKKEAMRRAVETDKFDDYAAEWDSYGGGEITLNSERVEGLRDSRGPARLAAEHVAALALRAAYQTGGGSVPAYLEAKIARTAPQTSVAA